jgi:hypothetical protein
VPLAAPNFYKFDGNDGDLQLANPTEFHPSLQPLDGTGLNAGFYSSLALTVVPSPSSMLQHLWTRAQLEWTGKFGL